MSKEVRTYIVTPDFWQDQPEVAGRLLAEHMAKHPDAFWMVLVASREDAQGFMETQLWHMRPAEPLDAS